MPQLLHRREPPAKTVGGFTLVELICVVAIVAILVVSALVIIPSFIGWAKDTSNRQTLTVLNDALTRFKCQGGDLSKLSGAYTCGAVLRALATPVNWNGLTHQFLNGDGQQGIVARSLASRGTGKTYRFIAYNGTELEPIAKDLSSSTAIVSTYAGTGTGAELDGPRLSAQFNAPFGLLFDSNGNLFVGDHTGGKIRKITPDGAVTTVCSLSSPIQLTWGPDGLMYVGTGSNRIYQVNTSTGDVVVFAGGTTGNSNGTRLTASFTSPYGVAFDNAGNLYVAEFGNQDVRKIDTDGNVTTLLTNVGTVQSLFYDAANHALILGTTYLPRVSLTDLSSVNVASSAAGGNSIILDAATGYLYSTGGNMIRKTPLNGGAPVVVAGTGSSGHTDGPAASATFNIPRQLAFDSSGNLYVAEQGGHYIRKISNP